MTTDRQLIKRLLKLYPIKITKDHFQITGNQDDVLEAVSEKSAKQIKEFTFIHHSNTKQNIYLFNLVRKFSRDRMPDGFPFTIEKEDVVNGEYSFLCLPKVTYSVYLSNPTTKEDIDFLQPVIIRVKGTSLIVQYTKLKKDFHAYFSPDREPKKAKEINGESDTLAKLSTYFDENYGLEINDINAGVKHLWHKDLIDCFKIHRHNPWSVAVETMDGTLTFKEKYPDEYLKIILKPIGISIWKYLKDDDYFCEGLTIDPTEGFIGITSSPKLPNQVNNVINTIIDHN
jgi:hypothetical protein